MLTSIRLKPRRRGRPPLADGPADLVPVRLYAKLRAAVEMRAVKDHTTTSDVISEALRRLPRRRLTSPTPRAPGLERIASLG